MTTKCNINCAIVGWARKHFCPTCPGNTDRPHLKEIYDAENAFSTTSAPYEHRLNGFDPDTVSLVIDPGFEWHEWPGSGGELRERRRA